MRRLRTSHPSGLVAIPAIGLLLCVPVAAPARAGDAPAQEAAAPGPEGPESARAVLAKWMETERIIAQERAEWQHSRDMLRARIDLVKSEIQAQQQKTGELRAPDK